MKRSIITVGLLYFFLSYTLVFAQSSFRLVTYNLLQYDGSERNEYFKTVLDDIDPDLIVVQEIESQAAVDAFAETVLNNEFATIPFHDGYTSDNHIFYNPFIIDIISAEYIPTDLRDIAEFKIRFPRAKDTLFIYSAHLKAGNPDFGDDNEDLQRLAEVTILRDNYLNYHPEGTKFIVTGDLNLYGSDEPAYQKLLAEEPENFGRSFDPINRPGGWHNNPSFADIHTQSTRATDLGDGGSTGGLDDRFDFILVSETMLDKVETGSYEAYGNDGNHFNESINNGTNGAVSTEVANALHSASDHLPVIAVFDLSISSLDPKIGSEIPAVFKLYQNYPNPFNPTTIINYELSITNYVELSIYNLLGQEVVTLVSEVQNIGHHQVEWNASGYSDGVYFYKIEVGNSFEVKKMVLLK